MTNYTPRKINRVRSSNLFLIELIVAILIFSAVSATCVGIFLKAHSINENTENLNVAVSKCSSIAEIAQTSPSSNAFEETLLEIFPQAKAENGLIIAPFKKDSIEVSYHITDGLITYDICYFDENHEQIYSIVAKHNTLEVKP